ncbi:MAG: DUF4124 domain-containing protein, partial [Nitrospinota bacterium]
MLNAWILKFGFFSTILTFTLLFYSENSYSEIYKWVDENGIVHFSDDLKKIPEEYRGRVEKPISSEKEKEPS